MPTESHPQPIALAPGDPLAAALQPLQMTGAFYCASELTAPWGMTLPPLPGYAWFHVISEGGCELEVEGGAWTMHRGDLALVPHGTGHVLRSAPGVTAPDILDLNRERVSDRYELLRDGGGGERSRMICGAVRFDHPAAQNLVDLLPGIVRVEGSLSTDAAHMQTTLALIAAETIEPRAGGEAVVTRLADILVIQAIRAWIETDPDAQAGWLGALRDERIGHALTLIHAEPERSWTVAELAREVAMSRSAFAARFTELVGVPVLRYLTEWRMRLAQNRLEADGVTVATVAAELGYGSEAAFARAFKRVTGTAPRTAARERRAERQRVLTLAA
ncbi:MAG TPA: AraC family transcriptional regulator [Solirubrobacterales bacterium]|nr:AraC family transcriptional regulator [Solirubrobacterales bacterium]